MENNQRFDDMLVQDLESSCLPCDILKGINPWSNSFYKILWGMGLSTFAIPVLSRWFYLLGLLLLYTGFRSLRQENRWFRAAWLLSLWRLGCWAALMLSWATPLNSISLSSQLDALISVLAAGGPLLLQYICLWQGILAVYRKAGQPPNTKAAVRTVLFYLSILLYALVCEVFPFLKDSSGLLSSVLAIAELSIWAFVFYLLVKGLWNTAVSMDQAGFSLSPAPVRFSTTKVIFVSFAALALSICACLLFFRRVPMPEAQPVQSMTEAETVQVEPIQFRLTSLGFPIEVLERLPTEELLQMDNAVQVELTQDGRLESTNGILCGCSIVVTRSDGSCRVLHHFFWEDAPELRLLESIVVFPCFQELLSLEISQVTGGLLWQSDGTAYSQEIRSLERASCIFSDGSHHVLSPKEQIRADFSLPSEAQNISAYVAYDIQTSNTLGRINYNFYSNYGRMEFPLNYPWSRPLDGTAATSHLFPFCQLVLFSQGKFWYTQEWMPLS